MPIADPPSSAAAPTVAPDRTLTTPARVPVGPARPGRVERWAERALLVIAFGVTVLAVCFRFIGPRALWLDEALTVNISRLPLPRLFDALRHDGSPPGYYVLLHYWMGLFGTATWTVRALAGVFSLATIPVAWRLGRAIGGRRVATALVVLMATSPFALRYATENRMYSLVMFLATLAGLTLVRALQRPTVGRLFGFGLVCGFLLLTHYWALYLVAGLGCCLVVASVWGPVRANARLALVALCGGGLLFVPWLPSFLFQAQHTGTPWSTSASPMAVIDVLGEFAGYEKHAGIPVFVLFWVFIGVLGGAVILRTVPGSRWIAEWFGWRRAVPGARFAGPVLGLFLATMAIAMAGGMIAHAAFAWRYASVVMPFVVLLLALGVVAAGQSHAGRLATAGALAVLAVLGTLAGVREILDWRTQAVQVAAAISADAHPGDLVAYCPDQLGPAVSRLLPDRLLTQVTYPRFDDPQRINWVDYNQVNAAANPGVFANEILSMAGNHQIWLVWEAGYRTLGRGCQEIRDALEVARPDNSEPVRSNPAKFYEHENLIRLLPG